VVAVVVGAVELVLVFVAVPAVVPVVVPVTVLVDPVPEVPPAPLVVPLPLVLLDVVDVAGAVLTVLDVAVAVVDEPVVVALVLSDAVCVTPLANLVLALADVILPLASKVYCAVPVPAPHAVSITATPVKDVSESARIAVMSNDTFNVKSFSCVNYLIPIKRSHANACVRALLYEKSSLKNEKTMVPQGYGCNDMY